MTSDPRVFFASERTLLAWIRTGIAIVGLGFIISRFSLFLRVIALQFNQTPLPHSQGFSQDLGVLFVGIGALSMVVATIQHGRFIATLPENDKPAQYSRLWALFLGGLIALASILLAIYLWLTTH